MDARSDKLKKLFSKRPQGGKYASPVKKSWRFPLWAVPLAFFLVEVFAFAFLTTVGDEYAWRFFQHAGYAAQDLDQVDLWPLAFGALWALLLSGLLGLLPAKASRVTFGIAYFAAALYAGIQTGYFLVFREMMWLSDFRYVSEGMDYASVLLSFPIFWWTGLLAMFMLGGLVIWKYPRWKWNWKWAAVAAVLAAASVAGTVCLPGAVFQHDRQIKFAGSDYGRAQSAEAAYQNMFNAHRLYQVCGLYQTGAKDIAANILYPLTPGYARAKAEAAEQIDSYFAQRPAAQDNEMTGIFAGKNVVLVLMESMDDWAIGEHTPTICRMMAEGINFTSFYTPPYGGVRTFNSEFCANTGTFLSSRGGYAFDYVTNSFRQSLAGRLTAQGYSALVYHYNDPSFYSRGVFSPAMGYGAYICYQDYVTEGNERDLYDDQFLFNYEAVSNSFFREGPKLNFIITRSAHMSYVYNEVLSYWGLQKYPEYRGLTGDEEEDCMYLKARLVDDLFARLLEELEAHGELENTVIVAFTDHYTYAFEDQQIVLDRSGVDDALLVEKTPCFIWSADGPAVEVDKTLNTSDLLPTVLNLLGVDSPYSYIGQDAFDPNYVGYALFPDGSWVTQGIAYNSKNEKTMYLLDEKDVPPLTDDFRQQMAQLVNDFVRINNLILESDYYSK